MLWVGFENHNPVLRIAQVIFFFFLADGIMRGKKNNKAQQGDGDQLEGSFRNEKEVELVSGKKGRS